MCSLAGVSRAGYYRHWRASAPAREETAARDAVQRLSLEHRFYGYRRITALLRQSGWAVNHKRVQRIRQSDNLLCVTGRTFRSEEHTSELQSRRDLVCRLLLEK